MIEFQHEKDRRRFVQSMELAKKVELEAEDQRVEHGHIPQARRPLIESLFQRLLVKPNGAQKTNQ